MLGDLNMNRRLINTELMKNNAADYCNCLGLSIVILLTPQGDLFSAPRRESRPARYPRSVCQPVRSQNCIRHVIFRPHACDNGMPQQVKVTQREDSESCVQTNHKLPPYARSVFMALAL